MVKVLLLAGRDTIAYAQRPGRQAVASAADLVAALPADLVTADVVGVDVTAEPGWDISPATMLALARRVRSAILDDGFDGVVVTHGTDALAETAYLTDLLAGPAAERGGIVFTAAARFLDDLSADGPRNLAAAITAAADPTVAGLGAVLCADDRLHAARWAAHLDATGVAAFSSAPHGPLGLVLGGTVDLHAAAPPRPPAATGEPETAVALVKTYPGIDAALITAAVDAGAAGVVLEGTGAGNVPASLFATISDLVEWNIPVVVATRCHTGRLGLPDLGPRAGLAAGLVAKLGVIGARGLAADKARVALMVALGAGGVAGVRAWFDRL